MISRIASAMAFLVIASSAVLACEGRLIEDERIHASPLCVPSDLQRIVVMDQSFALGIGLELGLPIVGAPLTRMSDMDLLARAEAAGVQDLGFVTEPNLERIVALQPDLIIGFTGDPGLAESFYPMLSSLAPTLLDVSGDWQGFYDILGELVGQQDKVEALFSDYVARLQDVRERVPETAVSIVRITPWDFQVYTDTQGAYAPFQVLSDAGVRRSDYETAPNGPALKRPDWEELAQLDGDILLYIVGGTNDSASSGRHEEVIGNPLWRLLPAVQITGRVHQVDPATWMEFSGLSSAHRVLDDIERLIINAE